MLREILDQFILVSMAFCRALVPRVAWVLLGIASAIPPLAVRLRFAQVSHVSRLLSRVGGFCLGAFRRPQADALASRASEEGGEAFRVEAFRSVVSCRSNPRQDPLPLLFVACISFCFFTVRR